MIQKIFRLEESDVDIIKAVKTEQGLGSDAEAVRFLIRQYETKNKKANNVSLAILRSIEEKQALILEAVNTILIEEKIDSCWLISEQEAPVLKSAREEKKAFVEFKATERF